MKNLLIGTAVFTFVCLLRILSSNGRYAPTRFASPEATDASTELDASHMTDDELSSYLQPTEEEKQASGPEKLAYISIITGCDADPADPAGDNDVYLKGAMMLAYQILHAPATRTEKAIPFFVMVTSDVTQQRQDKLTAMGARVIPIEFFIPEDHWLMTSGTIEHRFRRMFAKLRAWEALQEYSRALLLDTDMILKHRLDKVFDDPMTSLQSTNNSAKPPVDEQNPPSSYIFAAYPETAGSHETPPTVENGGYPDPIHINAGFMVFSPNLELFEYYQSLVKEPGKFDPKYPEQNLLNYAHRRDGPMPWRHFEGHFNTRFPTSEDFEQDVTASYHDKWWAPEGYGAYTLRPYYEKIKSETEGFYEAAIESKNQQQQQQQSPA
ncbi:MAG: hypothetical protein Q9227_003158 [Pyrenula ochraceoflavens]